MSKMTQRAAVYAAVMSVLSDKGIAFEDGDSLSEVMTDEIREAVHGIVVEGFRSGSVTFEDTPSNREKMSSEAKLNGYVSGLLSNWFRKDTRFNGGEKYTPKNPGSRAGQGDAQLKTLRALAKQYAGTPKADEIQGFITKRLEVLAAAKKKEVALTPEQIAALPAEVRESLGL